MKNTTPRIPIKAPMNSTVEPNSASAGAHNNAIRPPTTIIGIPTPKLIVFDAIYENDVKIYMKFVMIVSTLSFDSIFFSVQVFI